MEKQTKNDEIDLMKFFLMGIRIFRANFWMIVGFFTVGTLIGLANYYSSKKVYESKMMVSSVILTKSYGKILIENINRLQRDGSINTIVNQLKVSETTAAQIVNLKIENLAITDETKESERFIITAQVLDQTIFPDLQKGLIYYFENNEFVKVRVRQNENYYKQMITKVDLEIKDMEAFKTRIFKGDFFESIKGGVMFDPTAVNSKILELTREKINLQNSLELVKSVQVIEGFSGFGSPIRPKLSISLVSGSFIGLIFVGILIAFKSIRKILRMSDAANLSS